MRKGNVSGRVLLMSDVVYKPPYIPRNVNVPPSKPSAPELFSYLAIYGSRIHVSQITGPLASGPLYTCPEGKTFFLTAIAITATDTGGVWIPGAADGGILFLQQSGGTQWALLSARVTRYSTNTATLSPSIPVRLVSGEIVSYFGIAGVGTSDIDYVLIGYEIDNAVLNSIL